jgi:CubicO group peptidase (beta-lactamase class C family)
MKLGKKKPMLTRKSLAEYTMLVILPLLLAGCSISSKSQTHTPTPTPLTLPSGLVIEPEAIDRLEAKLAQMTQDGTFSGSVLIAQDGEILLRRGYGLADRLQRIPNTPQTRFHLGSTTKLFSAMGILILQSQSKLSIQDPICNFFEDCPMEWQDITIHHLLTHTSGLSGQLSNQLYREIEGGTSGPVAPAEQAYYLDLTSQWFLDTPPGEQYAYNNFGYILLAHIIEEVSGQSYINYLNQAIFSPLKMGNTGYQDSSSGVAKLYDDHISTTERQVGSPPISDGSGQMYSSCEDLFLWEQALNNDQLLPESELKRMFEPYVPQTEYPAFGYGYGWFVGEVQGQSIVAGAGGGVESPFGTLIVRFPQSRLTMIILANQNIDQLFFLDLILDELSGKK